MSLETEFESHNLNLCCLTSSFEIEFVGLEFQWTWSWVWCEIRFGCFETVFDPRWTFGSLYASAFGCRSSGSDSRNSVSVEWNMVVEIHRFIYKPVNWAFGYASICSKLMVFSSEYHVQRTEGKFRAISKMESIHLPYDSFNRSPLSPQRYRGDRSGAKLK